MKRKVMRCMFLLAASLAAATAGASPGYIHEWTGDLPLPYSTEGFGTLRNQYVNGCISCFVNRNGQIGEICFQGGQNVHAHEIFKASETGVFAKLFRVQTLIDETPYRLTFSNVVHHPYGYTAECEIDGVKFGHELVLDGNVLFQRVKVLSNLSGRKIRARAVMAGHCWTRRDNRTHGDFALEAERGRFTSWVKDGSNAIDVAVGLYGQSAVFPLQDGRFLKGDDEKDMMAKKFEQKRKYYVESKESADEFVFYLAFNAKDGEDLSGARIDRVHRRFAECYVSCAKFETGDRATDSALSCVAPVMAAHEARRPGAYRASPTYWVWGWDAMVHADMFAIAGQPDGVRRMLDFLRETAHPDAGLMHAYNYEFAGSMKSRLAPPTQPFYAMLLFNYYNLTGDKETLSRCLPLARLVVDRVLEMRRPGEALVRWQDMFPDNPFTIGETRNDFSAFNNSIFYQGLKAVAVMTGERKYFDEAEKVRAEFERLFWDDKAGFFCNWADGDTKKGVDVFQAFDVLYISPWAFDFKGTEIKRIASFMKRNFLANYGIRNLHWSSPAFMQDGVQQGEYFPVTERYYWNVMNRARDIASLEDFRRIHGGYWRLITYPEGQTLEVENADILDFYEDNPGMKQIFTAKAWLASGLELWLGLEIGSDGLKFNPMNDGKPFSVRDLVVRGKKLNVTMTGAGTNATMRFNGRPCDGEIPYSAFDRDVNTLEINVSNEKPRTHDKSFHVTPGDIPNGGITFVDYSAVNRSGHMGQAVAEYARDSLLAFYPNTSGSLNYGHTGYGWMEYRRSTDGGRTWSGPTVLDYSYRCFIDGKFTVCCEKAEVTDNGTIVLFCCRNSALNKGWEPYLEPMALRSTDQGRTWSAPIPVSNEKGRIYATRFKDGVIYVMEFCNGSGRWCGNKPEHLYRLYVSEDDGRSFKERSVVAFESTLNRAYGALEWLPDGRLAAYCYNVKDEYNMDVCVSSDNGRTWGKTFKSHCSRRIRNPQICRLGGTYFLHGRSGNNENDKKPCNFILYASTDGIHWDDGRFLHIPAKDCWGTHSFYSGNCVLGRFGGRRRVLVQASVPYFEARENVAHWWIDE